MQSISIRREMISLANKKIGRALPDFDVLYLEPADDGSWSLVGQNISERKNRRYAPKFIQKLSEQEKDFLVRLDQEGAETFFQRQKEKETAKQSREEFINSLPDEINGFQIRKGMEAICDGWGNYLCSIPDSVQSLEDLERLLDKLDPSEFIE